MAFVAGVPPVKAFRNMLGAVLAMVVAIVTVGLTAPADGPFSIDVTPVFLRLGVDLDVKLGSMHLHASWSALPSTKQGAGDF